MAKLFKTTFRLRRGSTETWEKNNPVLAYGEPAFDKDKYIFKIGDGKQHWKDLKPIGAIPDVSGQIEAHNNSNEAHQDIRNSLNNYATKKDIIDNKLITFDAFSTDGTNYTGVIEGLTELKNGMLYVMVVKNQSNSRPINLNINNLGFKAVYRLGSDGGLSHGYTANWLRNGNPYIIMYSYGYWRIINYPRSAAEDLIGTVPISKGGHGGATAAEARANLEITPENIGALPNTTVIPAIDSTLSISGQAADAKAVGEAIAASLLTDESIDALIALII